MKKGTSKGEGDPSTAGEPRPISPFQEAVNGVNAVLWGTGGVAELQTAVDTLLTRVSTGLATTGVKQHDTLELAKRYGAATILLEQASLKALAAFQDEELSRGFKDKAEGLGVILEILNAQSEPKPALPQPQNMQGAKSR